MNILKKIFGIHDDPKPGERYEYTWRQQNPFFPPETVIHVVDDVKDGWVLYHQEGYPNVKKSYTIGAFLLGTRKL